MYEAYRGISDGGNEPVWRFRTMSGLVRNIAGFNGTYSVVRSGGGSSRAAHQEVEIKKLMAYPGDTAMHVVARLLVPDEAIDADRGNR